MARPLLYATCMKAHVVACLIALVALGPAVAIGAQLSCQELADMRDAALERLTEASEDVEHHSQTLSSSLQQLQAAQTQRRRKVLRQKIEKVQEKLADALRGEHASSDEAALIDQQLRDQRCAQSGR